MQVRVNQVHAKTFYGGRMPGHPSAVKLNGIISLV